MKTVLENLIREMVNEPNAVVIEEVKTPNGTVVLTIRTAVNDAGQVIGRQGHNIRALRTIAAAIAARRGHHAILEVHNHGRKEPMDTNGEPARRTRARQPRRSAE